MDRNRMLFVELRVGMSEGPYMLARVKVDSRRSEMDVWCYPGEIGHVIRCLHSDRFWLTVDRWVGDWETIYATPIGVPLFEPPEDGGIGDQLVYAALEGWLREEADQAGIQALERQSGMDF